MAKTFNDCDMITNSYINEGKGKYKANNVIDCSLGNKLFNIAGIIGIAAKNGYKYGFPAWNNQEYFMNKLPVFQGVLKKVKVSPDLAGFDFAFKGFDFPDNIDLEGEFGSWKYFEHCSDLIKFYFTLKKQCNPYKNCIIIHYRDYKTKGFTGWAHLTSDYYEKAIKMMPKKKIIVVTDNIDEAQWSMPFDCEFTSNNVITDFYLITQADYIIMANSTFSWWGAYLSNAKKVVAPLSWYANELAMAPTKDKYLPNWNLI